VRTGISWLDGPATALFAIVTVLSLIRLFPVRGHDSVPDFLDAGFHAVMGVAMVAMFWPSAGSTRVWVGLLGSATVWVMLVFAQASRSEPAPPTSPTPTPTRDRWPVPRIGYYLASTAIMIIALGAGHGSLLGGSSRMVTMLGMGSTPTLSTEIITDPSSIGTALATAAVWPIWPFVAGALLLYGGWLAFGATGHGRSERVCAVLMAAGMALMAFSI
jgi:hypothetical protein